MEVTSQVLPYRSFFDECHILSALPEEHDARIQIENEPSKPSIIYAMLGTLRLLLASER